MSRSGGASVSDPGQRHGPARLPLSARQTGVLTLGTGFVVMVGLFFIPTAALAWFGVEASPPGYWGPGEKEQAYVKAFLLFPGPWVALLVAWIGCAVFRRRNRPGPAVGWFSAVLLPWFLASSFWSLPWLFQN